jgi:hypothetical protein
MFVPDCNEIGIVSVRHVDQFGVEASCSLGHTTVPLTARTRVAGPWPAGYRISTGQIPACLTWTEKSTCIPSSRQEHTYPEPL